MKDNFMRYITLFILIFLTACSVEKHEQAPSQNAVFKRVMSQGVLRCGYASWDPILIIDPKTGDISGIAHDVIEAAAQNLGLKVQWVEESGWGEYITGLKTKRYDAFCAGPTPNTERARELLFTDPFMFTRLALYTQANNDRLDGNRAFLNNVETSFAELDGTTSLKILNEEFPNATHVSYPEAIPFSQMLVEVGENKVDATLQAIFAGNIYKRNNPNKIKVIKGFEDFRVLENVFMVNNAEFNLREILNEAIDELRVAGKLDQIIDKYETEPGEFYRVSPGYQISKD